MSLKSIDAKQTISTVEDGVTWYSNPALNVTVLSDGRVFNNKSNKFLNPTSKGLFSVYFTTGNPYSNPTTYDSLITHLLGLERGWGEKIKLKDESKGYVQGNLQLVKVEREWKNRKPRTTKKSPVKEVAKDIHLLETAEIEIHGYKLRVTKADHVFTTEDFQTFDNKKSAIEHQHLVDKGKEFASHVHAAKAGFILASEIFHKIVPATDIKYKNFKDVLFNNSGIVESGNNPTYRFIEQPNMGDYKELLLEKEFSKTEATQIATLLSKLNNLSSELLTIIVKD